MEWTQRVKDGFQEIPEKDESDGLKGDEEPGKLRELFSEMTIGFSFLLRVAGIENVGMKGLMIAGVCVCGGGGPGLAAFWNLHISGSKTDQYNLGNEERLEAIGFDLRPVMAIAEYLSSSGRGPTSDEPPTKPAIRGRLPVLMELPDAAKNFGATRRGSPTVCNVCGGARYVRRGLWRGCHQSAGEGEVRRILILFTE